MADIMLIFKNWTPNLGEIMVKITNLKSIKTVHEAWFYFFVSIINVIVKSSRQITPIRFCKALKPVPQIP